MSWPMVRLDSVCTINMGQAPAGNTYNDRSEGDPLIAGAGDFGEINPIAKKHTTGSKKTSGIDDIILCIRATIGEINWSDRKYCLGRGVAGLAPNVDQLDSKYLWYFIISNKDQLISMGTGSTFKQVSKVHVAEWEIPLPPLPEQKRIAAILDKADAIRRKRKQAIELANEFLWSVFLDMFGDPVVNPKGFPFGTVRDLVSSVNYGTSGKASEESATYPILRMGNITYDGGWNFTSMKYIELTEKEKPRYLVKNGDLLFNRTNSKELVGKTAVYNFDEPMAIAGYLIRVRPNNKGNNYYISGYLNSSHGKQTLQSMCKSIVGMANINAQELQDIKIMIPPKALQDKYANIYSETQLKIKRLHESLANTDTLFSSLSQKAFSGNL